MAIQVAVHVGVIVFLHIGVAGLGAGDEGTVSHVARGLDLGLEGACLRLGQRLVHKGHDGVLLLEVGQIPVGVVGHQREGAHDQQTGHGDTDGGKGHEPVGEHVARALFDEKT